MSFASSLLLLLLAALAANALATPQPIHHAAHHRALAARVAAPAPLHVPSAPLRKRQNSKRCKQRTSSSPPAASSTRASSSPAVVNVAPTPKLTTTTKAAEPTPTPKTTTRAEPATTRPPTTTHTTSTKAPAPAPTTKKPASSNGGSNLPSFMVGTQTGQGTFYATGLGACGITNKDTDHIAAVSHLLFDNFPGYNGVNPNNNPLCGRTVTATYQGKSVTVSLTDRCTGCAVTDLDFSPTAFNELADFAVGRISGMTWVWND
ncbi:hypothetical protein BDN70DRAFT_803471 [Pholiota conissans]|uniref:RlpA-like protein double-psi beta-barrel domain-containing protein n=1 Tax=Pholiota conissans TaxID=109636 RepID=A0A9P6CV57_9AGAR|nr:hypothetical protein BDN70DRAFT_803471 [Pholiota conissans]